MALSSTAPAGPTNGRPVRSSASPGCSPTSTIGALAGPSPNTACVALANSGHASQSCAAEAKPRIDLTGGTGSVGAERLGLATGTVAILQGYSHHFAEKSSAAPDN